MKWSPLLRTTTQTDTLYKYCQKFTLETSFFLL
jgi:hypothetical protein